MAYWLVKSDPEEYSWHSLVRDGKTEWTGVRNFQARNHLNRMKKGDKVFVYESQGPKEIVGIAEVSAPAHPDPTAKDGDWSCVELKALHPLKRPIPLSELKKDSSLKRMPLVTQSRLSVMPVSDFQWKRILKASEQDVYED